LLEQVAEFEKTDFKANSKVNQESSKPKLAPLNEGGVSELLQKEISRLKEDNDKLKARLRTLESQAMSALDDKSKAERALKDLQKSQGDQQEIANLEGTVAEMQKDLQDSLVSAKHDLLRVNVFDESYHVYLSIKELEKKFQQTAAYRNMKEITKNLPLVSIKYIYEFVALYSLLRYESDE
uniref:Leucine zipper transcription factor-like protein 1 n=1 Tax=Sinocyclocheilus grahami TaxID=75366 RepID=A0A672K969_SINGR